MAYFAGKVVAVTGAASGLGRAISTRLARQGARLALADVDAVGLEESAQMAGPDVRVAVVDVADAEAVHSWAAGVAEGFGSCDVLVNNAGLVVRTSIEAATYEDLELGLGVNLWGVIHGAKAFLPLLRRSEQAHLVNIASINAMVPFAGNGIYNTAKAGVVALSETLAQELVDTPVSVTCVLPGGVRTGIVRHGLHISEAEARAFDRKRFGALTPETAARRVLRAVRHRRRLVHIGFDSRWMQAQKRLLPRTTVRVAGAATRGLMASGRTDSRDRRPPEGQDRPG